MSPIKDFKLVYVAPNKENVFSGGDTVAGKVTFKLKEETKVKGVVVKVKGEARVHWTDGTGDRKRSHNDHRRYFKDKAVLVEEGKTGPLVTAAGKRHRVCVRARVLGGVGWVHGAVSSFTSSRFNVNITKIE